MAQPRRLDPIPQPDPKFLIDNVIDASARTSIPDMVKLAKACGPIYRLLGPPPIIVVSGYSFVDEVCDDKRFDKDITAMSPWLRAIVGDGLFSAETSNPIWGIARRILLPAFGPKALQSFVPEMLDPATQLIGKWERLNPDDVIDVHGDMTRLTLETIGLCGFDYRFNAFYRENPHPLVQHLDEAIALSRELPRNGPPYADQLTALKYQQFEQDVDFMNATVDGIIADRKQKDEVVSPPNDLLEAMLHGVDKKTGDSLPDQNIRYQTLTFLFAGHITTSSLLTWAIYFLLRNPAVNNRAVQEVDRVLGRDPRIPPTIKQINQLDYVSQILKETLRLVPVAAHFFRHACEDTVLGGRYAVNKDDHVLVLTPMLHRDPSVWGPDVDAFDPERFTRQAEESRPPNAWKPFGTGQRSCIGRGFALQEATLALGMILQRFTLVDYAHYQPVLEPGPILKPANFSIKVEKRAVETGPVAVAERPSTGPSTTQTPRRVMEARGTPLLVLYGSNTGTCEEFAHRIGDAGTANGFVTTVAPLDDYARKLPKQGALIVISASYNGNPPDNAVNFVDWLRSGDLARDTLTGVKYTVFGCGNHEWASTFQKIPREIDEQLAAHGATRMCPRGEGDAAADLTDAFEDWVEHTAVCAAATFGFEVLQPTAATPEALYHVEVVSQHASHPLALTYGALSVQTVRTITILENRELNNLTGPQPADRSTRHIVVALPPDVTYRTGDHFGVIPFNGPDLVRRVTARFGLDGDATIKLHTNATGTTFLPLNTNIRVNDLLTSYVELQDVATRRQIAVIARYTQCPPEKVKLLELAGEDDASRARYKAEVSDRRKSVLDLLDDFPSSALPFETYLSMLPRLAPRYYSVSSSPLVEDDRCSITVGVVDGPARSGHGAFRGTCSTYLSLQGRGDGVFGYVRDPKSNFRLPDDARVPIIMVGPGTGLAPFRGFLQERAALKARGIAVGRSLLFYGCRNPEQDFLYRDELEEFARQGVTELYVAFSRLPGQKKAYVQDRIVENTDAVWTVLETGGIIYVCGDAGRMAPEVQQAFVNVYRQKTGSDDKSAGDQWMADLLAHDRYRVDVWGTA